MNLEAIKKLIKLFNDSGLSKISVKDGDFEILLEGTEKSAADISLPITGMTEIADLNLEDTINAPMVGTFYRSTCPNQAPFVEAGDTVKEGDTLCIIEAMKVMNEIKADRSGKVKEVMLKDGALVEFAKPLFVME